MRRQRGTEVVVDAVEFLGEPPERPVVRAPKVHGDRRYGPSSATLEVAPGAEADSRVAGPPELVVGEVPRRALPVSHDGARPDHAEHVVDGLVEPERHLEGLVDRGHLRHEGAKAGVRAGGARRVAVADRVARVRAGHLEPKAGLPGTKRPTIRPVDPQLGRLSLCEGFREHDSEAASLPDAPAVRARGRDGDVGGRHDRGPEAKRRPEHVGFGFGVAAALGDQQRSARAVLEVSELEGLRAATERVEDQIHPPHGTAGRRDLQRRARIDTEFPARRLPLHVQVDMGAARHHMGRPDRRREWVLAAGGTGRPRVDHAGRRPLVVFEPEALHVRAIRGACRCRARTEPSVLRRARDPRRVDDAEASGGLHVHEHGRAPVAEGLLQPEPPEHALEVPVVAVVEVDAVVEHRGSRPCGLPRRRAGAVHEELVWVRRAFGPDLVEQARHLAEHQTACGGGSKRCLAPGHGAHGLAIGPEAEDLQVREALRLARPRKVEVGAALPHPGEPHQARREPLGREPHPLPGQVPSVVPRGALRDARKHGHDPPAVEGHDQGAVRDRERRVDRAYQVHRRDQLTELVERGVEVVEGSGQRGCNVDDEHQRPPSCSVPLRAQT
jgi:hypothetical protein